MVSFWSIYVYFVFPPALILLLLLVLPLPRQVQKSVVAMCDSILFLEPHPNIPLSLFWILALVSFLTLAAQVDSMSKANAIYESVKMHGGQRSESLVKYLAAERNVWIASCGLGLWIMLHRYRSLLKKYHKAGEELSGFRSSNNVGGEVAGSKSKAATEKAAVSKND